METAGRRLFIVLYSAVVVVVIALMVMLYVSLLPHFAAIGDVAFWVLVIVLACGVAMLLTFTYSFINILLSRVRRARNHEPLIVDGEVALYVQPSGEIYHASKEHNLGLIAPPASVTVEEVPEVPDETILELWNKGLSLRTIEKVLRESGVKYNRIQKVTSDEKQRLGRMITG